LKLFSPAKLNLWLRITGRREDGYHLIDSLFVPLDYGDEIEIAEQDQKNVADEITFTNEEGQVLQITNSTVHQAVSLLRETCEIPPLRIKILKRIPMGSGLGGGSSNAATVLTYLSQEYSGPTSTDELIDSASLIGADVPFFIMNEPSYVTGIGEELEPIEIPDMHFCVVYPGVHSLTPEAYQNFDTKKNLKPGQTLKQKNQLDALKVLSLTSEEIIRNAHNDLEEVVMAKHPEIGTVKEQLKIRGALLTQMTGSGSAVYGLFKDRRQADEAREWLRTKSPVNFKIFACTTSGV
jgi:4-diphosphocytidyl-2-C-methyl-D-erythritol kinase